MGLRFVFVVSFVSPGCVGGKLLEQSLKVSYGMVLYSVLALMVLWVMKNAVILKVLG